jgi:2-polyprenyl-3-methyl-5-hydroxy-6-metoxy-1,4-benzoquinol methylase
MKMELQPICPQYTPCKCCGELARRYGVVDFHKNCESFRKNALDVSGVPVYYHRCPACGFIFTTAFDHFGNDDFEQHIYNNDYHLIDPDYLESRPKGNAGILSNLFQVNRPRRVLDYGGGNGVLAETLRTVGFAHVDTYDPFVPRFRTRPSDRYDCVVCFEVVEHSTNPASVFADMNDLLNDSGMIFFSTLLQPADIDRQGLNWWYAAPRNAHVSLHTKMSLHKIGQRFGFHFGSFTESYHVFFRQVPDFAKHLFKLEQVHSLTRMTA